MAKKRVTSIDDLKNIYYVYGDEELLVEQAINRLKELFSGQTDADFNLEVMRSTEVGAAHVVDAAETIPLMASRRLIIATDVDRLSRKEQDTIAAYLDSPNPATTLVLVAGTQAAGGQRDSNPVKKVESSSLYKKAISVGGEALKFSFAGRGRQKKVEDWVSDEFRKRGKKIEPRARDMLVEMVGRDLRALADAVERICLFAVDKDLIAPGDVTGVVVPAAEQGIFELVDAVADRRRDVSLYLLNRLVRQGESPQRMFSLLLRQFRLISRCKAMGRDRDYGDIASELGIQPFLVGKCLKQAGKFSTERLRAAFGEFRRAQVEMHSNRYLPEKEYYSAVLEMLIVKIIG
jgi:DNA polymerase-3 subunit delta